jgi:hypothetical protein
MSRRCKRRSLNSYHRAISYYYLAKYCHLTVEWRLHHERNTPYHHLVPCYTVPSPNHPPLLSILHLPFHRQHSTRRPLRHTLICNIPRHTSCLNTTPHRERLRISVLTTVVVEHCWGGGAEGKEDSGNNAEDEEAEKHAVRGERRVWG